MLENWTIFLNKIFTKVIVHKNITWYFSTVSLSWDFLRHKICLGISFVIKKRKKYNLKNCSCVDNRNIFFITFCLTCSFFFFNNPNNDKKSSFFPANIFFFHSQWFFLFRSIRRCHDLSGLIFFGYYALNWGFKVFKKWILCW